jgi:hypothetical protein
MIFEKDKRTVLCGRLQRLGYSPGRCLKLYGEEFELVSEPSPDGNGYGIDGIARKSGAVRHLRIPLSTTQIIERELDVMERMLLVA